MLFKGQVFALRADERNDVGTPKTSVASTIDGVSCSEGASLDGAQPALAASETTLVAAASCWIRSSTDGVHWVDRARP